MFLGTFSVGKALPALVVAIGVVPASYLKLVSGHRVRNTKRTSHAGNHFWPRKVHSGIPKNDHVSEMSKSKLPQLVKNIQIVQEEIAVANDPKLGQLAKQVKSVNSKLPEVVTSSDATQNAYEQSNLTGLNHERVGVQPVHASSGSPEFWSSHMSNGLQPPVLLPGKVALAGSNANEVQTERIASPISIAYELLPGKDGSPVLKQDVQNEKAMLDEVLQLFRVVVFSSSASPSIVFPALLLGMSIAIALAVQIVVPLWVVLILKLYTRAKGRDPSLVSKGQYNFEKANAFSERTCTIQKERFQQIVDALSKPGNQSRLLLVCPDSEWVDVDAINDGPVDQWEPLDD